MDERSALVDEHRDLLEEALRLGASPSMIRALEETARGEDPRADVDAGVTAIAERLGKTRGEPL